MAKTRRSRRYYKRKGRWSSNIKIVPPSTVSAPKNSNFEHHLTLTSNPVQTANAVSQQYTVKNIELSYQIEALPDSYVNIENLVVYIMFLPQGMTVTLEYPEQHPEYIMAYRYLGSPDAERASVGGNIINSGRLPPKIKTRLSRRLQTGDSIIFLLVGTNNSPNDSEITINGLVRWWTKAN